MKLNNNKPIMGYNKLKKKKKEKKSLSFYEGEGAQSIVIL